MDNNNMGPSIESDKDLTLEENYESTPQVSSSGQILKPVMPPTSDEIQPLEKKPPRMAPQRGLGFKILTFFVIILAISVIFGLAFLFYYFATNSPFVAYNLPQTDTTTSQNQQAEGQVVTPEKPTTKIISFQIPDQFPKDTKNGSCWTNSLAQPYRQDAWRCISDNAIYDPCFETEQSGTLFCQMNPLVDSSFLMNITTPLPVIQGAVAEKDNWAWFVKLSDGTICSPFTGTRPQVGNDAAFYGCKSQDKNQQIVLVGDLIRGDVFTAKRATLEKQGTAFVLKSTDTVEIDTIWQ